MLKVFHKAPFVGQQTIHRCLVGQAQLAKGWLRMGSAKFDTMHKEKGYLSKKGKCLKIHFGRVFSNITADKWVNFTKYANDKRSNG